jgi:hypothetical protein
VKPGSNLAEASKEGNGSKGAVLPTIIIYFNNYVSLYIHCCTQPVQRTVCRVQFFKYWYHRRRKPGCHHNPNGGFAPCTSGVVIMNVAGSVTIFVSSKTRTWFNAANGKTGSELQLFSPRTIPHITLKI